MTGSVPGRGLAAVLVVLRAAFDGRNPWLATFHPDLGLRRQIERCVVERSEPDLDEGVARIGRIEET
jgi:hypothetical protein